MKIPMIHALVMNFALLVAVSSVVAEAQSANSPRELFVAAGEIRVDGKIRSVDLTQKQLVLDVSSFSLPDGKTSELAVPKSKIIVLNEDTLLHVRGAVTHKVAMADVKAGTSAIVIGQDAGSGQPLPAREVALWDKAETGVFGLSTQNADSIVATKPNNQVGQKADDNQAVEANDGPDEIAQNKASNVFAQGDFELANEQAKPQGWSYAATQNIQWLTENGNHYMHISRDNPHEGHIIGNKLILDPSWKKLKILARMRVQNLKVGTEEWQNARLSLRYEDATGKTVDYAPPLEFKTDSAWVTRKLITAIPNGTHHLVIEPGVYGPAGELDIDDIVIVPNPPLDALPIEDGFPAGKFEKIGSNGDPVGWDLNDRKRIQWLEEDGNHFVRVTSEVAHNYVMASGLFKLDPAWKAIKVRVRIRTTNLQVGPDPWDEARLWIIFQDANGKEIGPQQPSPNLKRDTDDWVLREVEAIVPPGAVYLHLSPALLATRAWQISMTFRFSKSNPTPQLHKASSRL